MFSRNTHRQDKTVNQLPALVRETGAGERRNMGALSRRSGADGERMVARLFKDYGYPAERGVQHDGRTGHADVEGVPYLHIEVKFWGKFTRGDLENAICQAERDSDGYFARTGEELIPVVVHKVKGAHGWNVSMTIAALLSLLDTNMPFALDYPDAITTFSFEDFMRLYMPFGERKQ